MVETLPFFAKVCKVICVLLLSRPARGAWIEIAVGAAAKAAQTSRPARGAWIEMFVIECPFNSAAVAPRKGRVD